MTTETKKSLRDIDVVTPPVRLAFPALFKPKPSKKMTPAEKQALAGMDEAQLLTQRLISFQAVLLIPPDVDLAPFQAAIRAAQMNYWGKELKLMGKNNPLHSCDELPSRPAGYEPGWHFVGTKSGQRPDIVARDGRTPIKDETMIYPGCWVRAFINAFAWDNVGGKGVSFGLSAIQLVRDDARLDGRRAAGEVFDPLEDLEEGDGGLLD